MISKTYTDGSYLTKTGGTWHLEDSSFKANQVLRMLARHLSLEPHSVCEIGCGAGGTLALLSRELASAERLVGYDASPQAHVLSQQLVDHHCEFVLGDAFDDDVFFDLALVLDVIEHVEDCFAFLRHCSAKATWKIYHVPLDANASGVLRGANCWDSVGHLHLFTIETALKSVEHSGQHVMDWFLTPVAVERPHRVASRITNVMRRVLPEKFGARLLGGYSIMILAR